MASPKSGRTDAGIRSDGANNQTDSRRMTTMAELIGKPGFAPQRAEKKRSKRRADALELIATVALTISLVVAATAVSLGNRSLVRGDFDFVERPPAQMPAGAPLGRAANWRHSVVD
jgi:hypothetical protein